MKRHDTVKRVLAGISALAMVSSLSVYGGVTPSSVGRVSAARTIELEPNNELLIGDQGGSGEGQGGGSGEGQGSGGDQAGGGSGEGQGSGGDQAGGGSGEGQGSGGDQEAVGNHNPDNNWGLDPNWTASPQGLVAYSAINGDDDIYYSVKCYHDGEWRSIIFRDRQIYPYTVNKKAKVVSCEPSFNANGDAIILKYTLKNGSSEVVKDRLALYADTEVCGNDFSKNETRYDGAVLVMTDDRSGGTGLSFVVFSKILKFKPAKCGVNGVDPSTYVPPTSEGYDSAFLAYGPEVELKPDEEIVYTIELAMTEPENVDHFVEENGGGISHTHSYGQKTDSQVEWEYNNDETQIISAAFEVECECEKTGKIIVHDDGTFTVSEGFDESLIDANETKLTSETVIDTKHTKKVHYTAQYKVGEQVYSFEKDVTIINHDFSNGNNASVEWGYDDVDDKQIKSATIIIPCAERDKNAEVTVDVDHHITVVNLPENAVNMEKTKITTQAHELCTEEGYIDTTATFVINGRTYNYVDRRDADKSDITEDMQLHTNVVKHAKVDSTCSKEGTKEYWECEDCHTLFSDAECKNEIEKPETIDRKQHNYDNHTFIWLADKEANDGSEKCILTVKCGACGETLTYTATEAGVEGTVGADTYTGVVTERLTDGVSCTATGRVRYDATFTITTATGEVKKFTATDSKKFPALGHYLVHHIAKDATCTEDGNVEYYECLRCHDKFADNTGSEIITEDIKILAHHDYSFVPGKTVTCTESGYDSYWVCKVCEEVFNKREYEATGHYFSLSSEVKVIYDNDMDKAYALVKCTNGSNIHDGYEGSEGYEGPGITAEWVENAEWVEFELSGYKKIRELTPATCTSKGHSLYEAEFVYPGDDLMAASIDKVKANIVMNEPMLEHKYDENGICTGCHKEITTVSIEKTGETVNTKNRVDIHVETGEIPEGYEVEKLVFYYNNTGDEVYKSVEKTGISSYTGRVADTGKGVKAYAVVTIKSTDPDDNTVCTITTDEISGSFSQVTATIEKTGEKISNGKNRVVFDVKADVPEGYTVVKTGVRYWNDEDFAAEAKTGSREGVTSYSAAVADVGFGVKVEGYVEVKATGSDEIITISAGEPVIIRFSEPVVNTAVTGTKISSGKNRVVFAVDSQIPEIGGYTLVKTGIYYDNTQGNSVYNIESRIAQTNSPVKSAEKEADTYSAAVADLHFGVTTMGYAVFKTTDGREITVYSDPVHGDYALMTAAN